MSSKPDPTRDELERVIRDHLGDLGPGLTRGDAATRLLTLVRIFTALAAEIVQEYEPAGREGWHDYDQDPTGGDLHQLNDPAPEDRP